MRNITDVDEFTDPIVVAENGDSVAEISRDESFQGLANRTANLDGRVNANLASITDIEDRLETHGFIGHHQQINQPVAGAVIVTVPAGTVTKVGDRISARVIALDQSTSVWTLAASFGGTSIASLASIGNNTTSPSILDLEFVAVSIDGDDVTFRWSYRATTIATSTFSTLVATGTVTKDATGTIAVAATMTRTGGSDTPVVDLLCTVESRTLEAA